MFFGLPMERTFFALIERHANISNRPSSRLPFQQKGTLIDVLRGHAYVIEAMVLIGNEVWSHSAGSLRVWDASVRFSGFVFFFFCFTQLTSCHSLERVLY